MAEKTIREITGTETVFLSDDYLEIDGDTEATRKMLLSSLETQIRNNLLDAELAILDGATLSTAELNILDGCTATYDELNYLADVTAGTGAASKAVVLDEDGDGSIARDLSVVRNIVVGGTTGLSGKLTVTSANIEMVSGDIDLNGNDLILDADGNSKLYEKTNDVISLTLGGTEEYRFSGTNIGCATAGANNLGGVLGAADSNNPNAWGDLNLTGVINMAEGAAPASAVLNGSCVIYMDSATGDLKVQLWHDGSKATATLADFSEL